MDAVLDGTLGQRRLTMLLLGLFAGVALLLALVGINGVTAYAVALAASYFPARRATRIDPMAALREG